MSKLCIGIIILLVILLLMYVFSHRGVYTEIEIDASSDKVWNVITDTDKYSEWNPNLVKVDWELKLWNTLVNDFKMWDWKVTKMKSKPYEIIPNKSLKQKWGYPWILTYYHNFELVEKNWKTLVKQYEDYYWIWNYFWNVSIMEWIYSNINKALKSRVLELNK